MTRSALDCVLAPNVDGQEALISEDTETVDNTPTSGLAGQRLPRAKLAPTIRRRRGGVRLVVTATIDPTLLRALREFPPVLVVVTGPDATRVRALEPPTRCIGPLAQLHVNPAGSALACAHAAGELMGLRRALGSVRLALAPTPAWLWEWIDDPRLDGALAVGFVPGQVLDLHWARWFMRSPKPHVLVPVGVGTQVRNEPLDPALDALVAAHTLERWTGPIFPAPRVLALVAGQGRDVVRVDPAAAAVWAQARRALPTVGATLGMDAADPELPLEVPTAAFLAQCGRLRVRRRRGFERAAEPQRVSISKEGRDRAFEVLAASGEHLSEHEAKVVLRSFGLEITRQAVASSASGAAHYAELIRFPIALKALSPDLQRKSELGLVQLDLRNAAAVKRAYGQILEQMEAHLPSAVLDGVLVSEMAPDGLDVRCGAVRMATGDLALYGRAMGPFSPAEATYALGPLGPDDALLLADGILSRLPVPAMRRATDPDTSTLAQVFLILDALCRETGDRILHVELGPLRLLSGERPHVAIDAQLTQRAHLDGA
ncbi:MAG: acetate--CoA ligase family protein [Nannocystaceae bacterium]